MGLVNIVSKMFGNYGVIRRLWLTLIVVFISGCLGKSTEKRPEVVTLTDNNFRNLVIKQSGPVLVYFSTDPAQVNVIKTNFDQLFHDNNEFVRFGYYQQSLDVANKYNVKQLPAVNYYFDGILVDQLASLPTNNESMMDLHRDIELWFYETVLSEPDSEKQFNYVFKGGHKLNFHPY